MSTGTKVPVDYRVFGGNVGGMFKIKILTNSSDAAVANVLKNVPVGLIISMLPEPDPHLLISTDLQTRDAEANREVPGPSVARRAYLLVKMRLDYSEREKNILNRMVEGRIMTWDDMFERDGTGIGLAPEILALLGDLPDMHVFQRIVYDARALRQTEREWT